MLTGTSEDDSVPPVDSNPTCDVSVCCTFYLTTPTSFKHVSKCSVCIVRDPRVRVLVAPEPCLACVDADIA